LLTSEREGGSLPVAIAAYGLDAPPRIAIVLEIQGASEPGAASADASFSVAAYAIGADGAVAASGFETIAVATPVARAALGRGGLRHLLVLAAPAGDYTVHALVRDAMHAD